MTPQPLGEIHCSTTEHIPVTRRRWLGWSLALAAAPASALAAQNGGAAWPTRPLQLIVPWPAGGATDLTLRILCEETEPLLGQPIVVINRPGAAGTQVAPLLKAAEPDGHTIGQVPITVYRHALMNAVPWDPVADLSPIVQVSGTTFGVLVPSNSPWKHFNEMLDWARSHPGELILGSTGIGTTAHLAMEEILLQHQVRYVHVPYRGTADQMLAVAGGQLMAGVNSTGFAPWVDQGKIRLLAIFSAQRSPRWPDAPTLRELGYLQSVYTSPWGIAAPRGTPEPVVKKLHDAFARAMQSERHLRELARYDQTLDYLNTRDYRQAVLDTVEREKRLLQRMNLLARPAGT
ncbi:MAG: tripartite tricarboxylate transporter substrate binding protein [Comamonadaceae bacterium]|nr:MAG: tripartite tricarboxylate transporter substrate binding protein [Comamonadaceae bacterium]